ncbi:MAG: trehalose-phosphatase [Gammaproteobacteria bacterium]
MYLAAVDKVSLPDWPTQAALFLDVDGTLLEFADKPHLVERPPRFLALLERLAGETPVAFISGRSIVDLDRILAPHHFPLAGIHGAERRNHVGQHSQAAADPAALKEARAIIDAFHAEHDGLVLEDKAVGLALHYRLRPDLEEEVHALEQQLDEMLPSGYGVMRGKMLIEVYTSNVDKGTAIREFMDEEPFAGATPVFIGDDVTDEAGFAVINALSGVSIKVDRGDTVARWRLSDVNAVIGWLEQVLPE